MSCPFGLHGGLARNAQNFASTVQQYPDCVAPPDGILIATRIHRNTAPALLPTRHVVVRPCMRTAAYESSEVQKTAEQMVGMFGRAPVGELRIQNNIDRRSCHDRPAKQEMRAHSMLLQCSTRPRVLRPSVP